MKSWMFYYLVEKIQTVLCCVVFLLNNVVIIEAFWNKIGKMY